MSMPHLMMTMALRADSSMLRAWRQSCLAFQREIQKAKELPKAWLLGLRAWEKEALPGYPGCPLEELPNNEDIQRVLAEAMTCLWPLDLGDADNKTENRRLQNFML